MDKFIPFVPASASPHAVQVDRLFFFLVSVAAFFSLLIAALIVIFVIRYRRRSADETTPVVRTSVALETTWTLIPLLLTMVIFAWGASLYYSLFTPPSDALEVFITGKQWMWKVQYPSGRREINTLYVPRGQPVKLTMTSEDTIHSFFLPAFRAKMDVLPNRYTSFWFIPTKPGEFHLFCAEYCGTDHSVMRGSVVVLEPWEFQEWLKAEGAGGRPESMAARGGKLYAKYGCKGCHEGETPQGPLLAGLAGSRVRLQGGESVVADENYLRESLLEPKAKVTAGYKPVMPTFKGRLSAEELNELVEFMKSMGPRVAGR